MELQADPKLDSLVLIFEEPFLLSFFNDSHFLDRFAYLRPERISPFLHPDVALQERLQHLLLLMKAEIDDSWNRDLHILRVMFYETLMLLNRAESVGDSEQSMNEIPVSRYVSDFVRMVDMEYLEQHDMEYYANKLGIPSNYLNKIIRKIWVRQPNSTYRKKCIKKPCDCCSIRLCQ